MSIQDLIAVISDGFYEIIKNSPFRHFDEGSSRFFIFPNLNLIIRHLKRC